MHVLHQRSLYTEMYDNFNCKVKHDYIFFCIKILGLKRRRNELINEPLCATITHFRIFFLIIIISERMF